MNPARVLRLLAIGGMCWMWTAGTSGSVRLAAQTRTQAARPAAAATGTPPSRTTGPSSFGFGRPATPSEIAAWDSDVRPDGTGLPPGRGTPADGGTIFAVRCAGCHGKTGKEGPSDVLAGREPRDGFPFSRNPQLPRTIGNYWPYATTVFDYIRRAMPLDAPGSLRDDQVYSLTAYLLFLNELIPADAVIDASSLPKVMMPAHDRFVPENRGRNTPRTDPLK